MKFNFGTKFALDSFKFFTAKYSMKQIQRSVIHGTEFQGIIVFFFNLVDDLEKVLKVQPMCVCVCGITYNDTLSCNTGC